VAAERNAYDGVDALMAALTDEPLPEGAAADAEFMAEHRVATAEVALLREQLGIIGEALSAPRAAPSAPEPETRARPVRRRRHGLRVLAYGTLATAVVATMITGLAWLVAHNGDMDAATSSSADSGSGAAQEKAVGDGGVPSDPAEYVACSSLVVEGTVAQVRPGPDPWKRITLTVIRSYRPAHGPAQVTFVLDGGAKPAPAVGQHVLVRVPNDSDGATLWAVGDARVAADRAWITEALPDSLHMTCAPG
jgi:hypothetical protein